MPKDYRVIREPREGVIHVKDKPVIVQCPVTYYGSDMGFGKEGWYIVEIYDRDGNLLDFDVSFSWEEIAPGISACERTIGRYKAQTEIRISPEACPVKVVFEYISEYNDYDGEGSGSLTTQETATMLFQN